MNFRDCVKRFGEFDTNSPNLQCNSLMGKRISSAVILKEEECCHIIIQSVTPYLSLHFLLEETNVPENISINIVSYLITSTIA